jgi:hypothetical protein
MKVLYLLAGLSFVIFAYFWLIPYLIGQFYMIRAWFLLRQVRHNVTDEETKAKLKTIEDDVKDIIKNEKL